MIERSSYLRLGEIIDIDITFVENLLNFDKKYKELQKTNQQEIESLKQDKLTSEKESSDKITALSQQINNLTQTSQSEKQTLEQQLSAFQNQLNSKLATEQELLEKVKQLETQKELILKEKLTQEQTEKEIQSKNQELESQLSQQQALVTKLTGEKQALLSSLDQQRNESKIYLNDYIEGMKDGVIRYQKVLQDIDDTNSDQSEKNHYTQLKEELEVKIVQVQPFINNK